MQRILIITRNFPPLVGGMERLVFNIYEQLNHRFACDLIAPRGSRGFVSGDNRVYECGLSPLSVFLSMALAKSLWATIRNNYSLCIAGSGLTSLIALLASKIRGVPCITFIHGLDLIAKNRIYQKLFVPAIRYSDLVIVNSNNTARLAEDAGVAPDKIRILHPGVRLPENPLATTEFRDEHLLENRKILLSVGRLITRKGLAEFILKSLPAIVREHPETVLVIIGTEPENALHQEGSETGRIREAIRDTHLDKQVLMIGRASERKLQAAFKESDLFIFPLQRVEGDVEGFGMVAVEAAAYGLASVAFAEGGVTDAIHHEKSGFLVPPGDYAGFSKTVNDYLSGKLVLPSPNGCQEHAASFQWDVFGDKLAHIVISTISQSSRQQT